LTLVEVGLSFVDLKGSTGGACWCRLSWVDLLLLLAGQEPLKIEFGDEAFIRKGEFLNSYEVCIPINEVQCISIPLVVGKEPLEEVF
jgi:hypothetical protein